MSHSYDELGWDGEIINKESARAKVSVQNHKARAANLSNDDTGNAYNKRMRELLVRHHEKRAIGEHERDASLHVLATHGASIRKFANAALKALDSHENAAAMRHIVKDCQMRLCILMDDARAAARALIEVDAADDE